ncbi:MAG: histidinol dehydrogenase [Candidatus Marinamargulisbacteria bacterium]
MGFPTINSCDELSAWMRDHSLHGASIDPTIFDQVNAIKDHVQSDGDAGLCALTQKFDHVALSSDDIQLTSDTIKSAYQMVSSKVVTALKNAAQNIHEYHLNQLPRDWESVSDQRVYGVQYRPLDAVGLYVPGGRAAYPSSVLMTAIPAVIAGCSRIAMVSPPTGGQIPPSVLVAADIAGVTDIYQVGGAQAVFALAYGTDTVHAVDKIVGPGNRFVTAAKQMVYGVVDIDKPAGPSEVCVYVDSMRHAPSAAAEMWAQLEHDPDASAICIAPSKEIALAVNDHAERQLPHLKRQSILSESKANGVIVIVDSSAEAINAINECASEHLVLLIDGALDWRRNIRHAGSIFCGPYTPVTLGDYYAGPNHVLPTARSARFASPLGVMDFMKYSSYLSYSKDALMAAVVDVDALTTEEGFDAHNQALNVRLSL